MTTIKPSTINFVREQAKQAAALADLAQTLTDVANQERDIAKGKAELDALKKKIADANAEVHALADRAAMQQNTLHEANVALAKVQKTADTLIADAHGKARVIEEEAKARAEHVSNGLQVTLEQLNASIHTATKTKDKVEAEIASRQRALVETNRALDDLESRRRKLAEGLAALK